MTAPLSPLRQPKRVRPRESELSGLPFPTTSECLRAVARALARGDLRRALTYQSVVLRRLTEAQRDS